MHRLIRKTEKSWKNSPEFFSNLISETKCINLYGTGVSNIMFYTIEPINGIMQQKPPYTFYKNSKIVDEIFNFRLILLIYFHKGKNMHEDYETLHKV